MESKPHKDDDSVETSFVDELDEAPRKYKRRGIVSNWSRYDQPPSWDQDLDDGTDYLIGEDFSDVLANQSKFFLFSDCSQCDLISLAVPTLTMVGSLNPVILFVH
jgi:hypothetical protein